MSFPGQNPQKFHMSGHTPGHKKISGHFQDVWNFHDTKTPQINNSVLA